MKRQLLLLVFIALCAAPAWAQSSGDFVIPLTDPAKRGKLRADIKSGSITIKGTPRKDVLIKYSPAGSAQDEARNTLQKQKSLMQLSIKTNVNVNTITADERDEDGQDNDSQEGKKSKSAGDKSGLKKIAGSTLDLEVTEHANVVKINSDSWSKQLNLEIEVPYGFDLNVSTYNDGALTVSTIQGQLELENYNDEIIAENISGSVLASTYNGGIKVTFDKVTEGVPMSFSTFNGDIDIALPAAFKGTFKMKTEQGEILSGFDMNMVKTSPVQKKDVSSGVYKVVIDEWVKGEVNGGGPEITMKNYNGDLLIRKK